MVGNNTEAWSCFRSRSDGDLLRVWFSYSPFVPSGYGVKVTAPLEVFNMEKQHAVVLFLVSEGMEMAEAGQLAAKIQTFRSGLYIS
jgi:hypothetical protein